MDKEIKISDLKTIPNIMTMLRIAVIVPFVMFFIREWYVYAAVTLGLSGLSDALDGYVARRYNQVTALGKILDPIADKLTLFAIIVCVTLNSPIIMPVMVILIAKDMLMLMGGTKLIRHHIAPPAAKWYGKVATVMFYLSVGIIVFLKTVFKYENSVISLSLLSVTTAMMLFSLLNYYLIYRELMKDYKTQINEKKE